MSISCTKKGDYMKYIIDDKRIFTSVTKVAQYIVEGLDETYFDEWLDNNYGIVDVCGYSFDASEALRILDETAYKREFADYQENISREIEDEVHGLSDEESIELYGYTIVAQEDEDFEEYE